MSSAIVTESFSTQNPDADPRVLGSRRVENRRFNRVKRAASCLAMTYLLSASVAGSAEPLNTLGVETLTEEERAQFTVEPIWEQNFTETHKGNLEQTDLEPEIRPEVPTWNDEEQAYTDSSENIWIEPGVGLIIQAKPEVYSYQSELNPKVYEYTSGRVNTVNSFTALHGKFEITMKLPAGSGVWPAFWLRSQDKEIDIMEFYGHKPNEIKGTVHTDDFSISGALDVDGVTDEFHTYGVELSPESIIWTFDGEPYQIVRRPSDDEDWLFEGGSEMHMIVNLAIDESGGKIDNFQAPWQLIISSIKAYDLVSS